jgi:hypothetical protein
MLPKQRIYILSFWRKNLTTSFENQKMENYYTLQKKTLSLLLCCFSPPWKNPSTYLLLGPRNNLRSITSRTQWAERASGFHTKATRSCISRMVECIQSVAVTATLLEESRN